MKLNMEESTPKSIVNELDKYIIGQDSAKKIVAIALRNRMRRALLDEDMINEVSPKNIIMIGPTGVGKTEIARRLSKLAKAPFIKVEATKFTEVGYVGRDVESMVRDLMASAVSMVKTEMQDGIEEDAKQRTEEILLDYLLPGLSKDKKKDVGFGNPDKSIEPIEENSTREKFRVMLKEGKLEDKEIEISVSKPSSFEILGGGEFQNMEMNIGAITGMLSPGGNKKKRIVTVKQAREITLAEQRDKLIDTDNAVDIARDRVQNMGIIFIDEIDKIAAKGGRSGGQDVSRQGVQRDILPIVEGSKVNTKHGIVDTSHILFIAAGAFSMSKPSDLIPELQGRFPLRVELQDLDAKAFEAILTKPKASLTKQYIELLKTEDVELIFKDEAIKRIAQIAADVNNKTENIGARRLHTILEHLLEDISFNAPDTKGEKIEITKEFVDERLKDLSQDRDLSRYIL
ncbi:ATP-dependent protease ATPase subunit HslU [Thiospirochaeta perfilievii]|uniref:ATP-dependent protease ATPase subunit HslU n=1 Tax=Thiospirochaeta perfilievii TaxID=252967 RepID=A0A5C1Q8P6_9SPIO|nr:ATP-dependent protease ATPase subunit HslU [Thiospirochaeta perfilievii]QEN03738.1 ATP-dependent protease ATPase subunit HslU [Thiospirochaeta perfilievii]